MVGTAVVVGAVVVAAADVGPTETGGAVVPLLEHPAMAISAGTNTVNIGWLRRMGSTVATGLERLPIVRLPRGANARWKASGVPDAVVYHFSEDPSIERFEPHVPRTNPSQPPAVWAIDGEHASLYWFPRDCPRLAAWPRTPAEAAIFQSSFNTVAHR